jgi:hypothetical protein
MVGGTSDLPVWSQSPGVIDGRKTAKNGNGAKRIVLLGDAGTINDLIE